MSFEHAVKVRRSYYHLNAKSPISDKKLAGIIEHALKYAPSAFNSQSSRAVLLKGEEHRALWDMAMEALRKIVPADAFQETEKKINAYAAAHGTILFFEDQDTIRGLQEKYPLYKDGFPDWSQQHTGIVQFIVWTALDEAGLGLNLQHYDSLIADQVAARWNLPKSWKLMGEMPFGEVTGKADEKDFLPVEQRFRVFG